MKPCILLIEDDRDMRELVSGHLEHSGFDVQSADDGIKGQALALQYSPDLILLDLMLPKVDGLTLCQRLRRDERTSAIPILMLTALGGTKDKVSGFNSGADDYLTKPFAFAELLARVRTLLRRGAVQPAMDQLRVADLVLDLPRRRAQRAGKKINLSHKEFCLLELLARRQGEVLPRSLIASQVWDMNFDSDTNVIDVAIRRLRAKIDDDFTPKLIHTVRGMGYTLEAESED